VKKLMKSIILDHNTLIVMISKINMMMMFAIKA
jgi:hypothetical protein